MASGQIPCVCAVACSARSSHCLVHLQREDEELWFIDDLVERLGHRKLLLSANSRSRCDRLFALLHHQGRLQATTYLHYSNLKPRQRQEVERQFNVEPRRCIATSTLELGIDIGDVDGGDPVRATGERHDVCAAPRAR